MSIFVLNALTAFLMLTLTLFSAGCNGSFAPPANVVAAPDEPVAFAEVADDSANNASVNDSERVARDSAEMERIRIEGQTAQGPVQNAPDYNR